MEVTFTTTQSAGRSGAPDTGRHALRGPGDWKRGEAEVDEEFESASEEIEGVGDPDAGRTERFLFLVFSFCFAAVVIGGKGIGERHYDGGRSLAEDGKIV